MLSDGTIDISCLKSSLADVDSSYDELISILNVMRHRTKELIKEFINIEQFRRIKK